MFLQRLQKRQLLLVKFFILSFSFATFTGLFVVVPLTTYHLQPSDFGVGALLASITALRVLYLILDLLLNSITLR